MINKRKIAALCIAMLTMAAALSGCVRYTELSDRAIVQALGVDYLPDKKVYRISLQYFYQTSEGGQNQIDKTQANVLKSVGEGENIMLAAKNASIMTGKDLMLSETRLLIFGSELCKYDLGLTLEFFVSNFHSHPQTYVACAENTAEEILDIKFKEGYSSSRHLQNLIENASDEGRSPDSYTYRIMTELQTCTRSTFLPILKITEMKTDSTIPDDSGGGEGGSGGGSGGEEKTEKTVVLDGTMLFSGGTAKVKANEEITTGIQLFRNAITEYTVSVDTENNQKATLTLYDFITDVTPVFEDERLIFDIDITAAARFDERGAIKETDTEAIMGTVKKASDKLKGYMEQALYAAVGAKADVFGLENTLRHNNPKFCRDNKEQLSDYLMNAGFEINIELSPFSLGLESY